MRFSGKILVAVVRSRATVFAGVAGACLALALAYGLLAADRYRAVATLFIDPSSFENGAPGAVSGSQRNSELDLLRSERVAQRVVENEGLVGEPALRQLYLQSIDSGRPPLEAMAQYLAQHIDATGSDDGGVVRLSVSLADAPLAARVANAYAQAWGEVSLELRSASIRSGVERAHEDLASLRARLGEARSRLSGGRVLAAAGSHADEQFAQLSRLSTRPIDPAPVSAAPIADTIGYDARARNDGAIPGIGSGASRLEASHPELHTAESPLHRVSAAPAAATSSADDEIRMAQQSLERAEDRLARLSAEGIGAPFPAHVLRSAAVPEVSSKPGAALCAAIGLVAGLALAMLAALLSEMLDRRVRHASDLSGATGIVVLGNLPAAKSSEARAGSAWRAVLRLQRAGGAF